MRVRSALLILMVMGCTREGAPPPALVRSADSLAEYLDDSDGCGFLPVARSTGPTDLVREYVRRDGEGEFLTSNPWLDSALSCAGHLPGWDVSTLISGAELTLLDSSATRVRVRVSYTVNGWHSGGLHIEPTKLEVDTFVVVPTPWGWRIDGPQLNQHILPFVMLKGFQLHGADSLAIEQLVGAPLPMPPVSEATLLVPGMDWNEGGYQASWLGLYEMGKGNWALRPATLKKGVSRDECREADVPVVVADPAGARFLVRSSVGLAAGSGSTISRTPLFVGPGDSVMIPIQGSHVTVEVRGYGKLVETSTGRNVSDFSLVIIETDGIDGHGYLAWKGSYSEVAPSVDWIGDLNGDGTVDALIRVPTAGYSQALRLLLSDYSGEEEVYRTVGEVQLTDC